jgi:hypothetical protein
MTRNTLNNTHRRFGILTVLFTLFVLGLFAAPVMAELVVNKYTSDFNAYSVNNEQLKLCACETKVDRIVVENTGQFYSNYHLEIRSAYPEKIRVVGNDFELAPGHFKEILVYIEDSCTVRGEFPYDVVVTSSYGRTQTISRSIRVDFCENARLTVTPNNVTVGLCDPATFQTTITNVGTYPDTFHLSFGPYDDIASIENRYVYLEAGQDYKQPVTFQFACTDYGTKQVPFLLDTDKNGPAAQEIRRIDITNEYGFTIEVDTALSACGMSTTQIPITLENNAPVEDEITLRVSGASFATIQENVHLDGRESKEIMLTLTPNKGDVGSRTITIEARDVYGGIQKVRDITLDVDNCYDVAAEAREAPDVAHIAPLQACCGQRTMFVNVENNGDRTQAFILKVDGPSFFVLDETTIRLEPQQNMNVPVRVTLPCADERYEADVIVMPLNQPLANTTAHFTIDAKSLRSCYMVQIDDDELCIDQDTQVIPVIVKHTGLEGGEYAISFDNEVFDVQEENITLYPGDQRAIHLIPKVNLTAQELGRYIVQPLFTYEDPALDYNEHVGIELKGKGFFQRLVDWWNSLPWQDVTLCIWVIVILLLVLLTLGILLLLHWFGLTLFPGGLSRTTLTVIKTLLVVLVLVVLVGLLFLKLPGREQSFARVANTTDATVLEWYQNEDYRLDLRDYFVDPDKDILSYAATQPQDINARISGTMMTLTPDHNFAGENSMVITASDARGGITDSPTFILRVIPRKDLTFLQWLGVWCHYIVLVELLLALLLLFLIVLTVKEARPQKNNVLVVVEPPKKAPTPRARTSRTSASTRKAVRKTARKPARKAKPQRANTRARSASIARNKSLVPIPAKRPGSRQATPARGRQVMTRTVGEGKVAMREFKAGGQTVNIAVGQPQAVHTPAFVAVPGTKQSEIIYVGAKGGNTVHTPYCMNARHIPRNKRVAFGTKKEAVNAGLVPCRMCRPFEGGI